MAIKGMLALVLVAVFAAIGAVVFSLDSMAASRDENDTPAAAAPAATHNHNVALPLESFVGEVPDERGRAGEGAQGDRRDPAAASGRRPRPGPYDTERHGRPDRARRDLQHAGLSTATARRVRSCTLERAKRSR